MKRILLTFLRVVFLSVFFSIPIFFAHAEEPIKILLVPGHDDEVWGAQYKNIKEADMNLVLATKIYNLLKKDKRFKVYITRDSGGYVKEFADYISLHKDEIIAFRENAKKEMGDKIVSGDFIERENVFHNTATEKFSIILYGINKWANENKMDAVLHIHFNDYPRSEAWTIGKYKGFVIYIPEGQLANWKESGKLAAGIFTQLRKKYITSTYEKESGGLIPDQKLIALGSNGTLLESVRSILIEYGYIYEKKFRTRSTRFAAYENMASLTSVGIKNYFLKK